MMKPRPSIRVLIIEDKARSPIALKILNSTIISMIILYCTFPMLLISMSQSDQIM